MKYGYIRVSTKEQNIDRQLSAILKEVGDMKQIYIDKASGRDFERKKYKRLIKTLKEGDELYIKSIDRLGRSYDDIIKEWHLITKVKNVDIIVLDFPLLNTKHQINNLTGKFLSDIVLQILSYVAQIERENTHQRQMEGIKEARKRGVKFGRSKKKCLNSLMMSSRCGSIKISLREGAKLLDVSHTTFSKWIQEKGYMRERKRTLIK